jgi:hypothetical protein
LIGKVFTTNQGVFTQPKRREGAREIFDLLSHTIYNQTMEKPKHKLDIFDTLASIDNRKFEFLNNKPDEIKKEFAPVVVLRWASSVTGPMAPMVLCMINEYANKDFFEIADHPDLQYRLMAATGLGRPLRHQWIPGTSRKKRSKTKEFLGEWLVAKPDEIDLIFDKFTEGEFVEFVNGCGLSPEDTKETINAFRKEKKVKVSDGEKPKSGTIGKKR